MSDCEPGAVATATVRGVPNVRVFRLDSGTWVTAEVVDGTRFHYGEVNDVRPLAVIDPEDREQVERLAREHHAAGHIAAWGAMHENTRADLTDHMQAALREFANPTAEPTDPAVRVGDRDGDMWASLDGYWYCLTERNARPRPWTELVALGPLVVHG